MAFLQIGILHVPLNVPALGVSLSEDNVKLDRELVAHGISNILSGCVGSVPNYLCKLLLPLVLASAFKLIF